MEPESIGKFELIINDCVATSLSSFKEVLVIEKVDSCNHYVNLAIDTRFSLFSSFGLFDRELSADELNAYNVYVTRKNQQQPLFQLSEHQIAALKELCIKHSKKNKK